MSELQDLYQEVIIDHSKHPRNFRVLENANRSVEGYNPLCGDHFTVYLLVDGDTVQDIGFYGTGCAISKASASMMTTSVKGKTVNEAKELFGNFHMLLAGARYETFDQQKLGKLAVFAGVREYPVRVKCATLAWHAMRAGLEGKKQTVSTETVPSEWEAG
jgi:nitrogen fixation NifU-like protein